jgi:hypothetical protein
MADQSRSSGRPVVVLSRSWGRTGDEMAFAIRGVAGALSRHAAEVVVVVPGGPAGSRRADGAFDVFAAGAAIRVEAGPSAGWPAPGAATLPVGVRPAMVVVEEGDHGALGIARHAYPWVPVVAAGANGEPTGSGTGPDGRLAIGPLGNQPDSVAATFEVDLYVPVNQLATERPHNGLGFVDYLLVLTDREGRGNADGDGPAVHDPTPLAAWLAAAYPTEHLVVVEGGSATVWRGRALRGVIGVDTRTDLWRLMAHARMTIDLAPGGILARECVESLRFGTPVVVPSRTAAARLAALGGGLDYGDVRELLACTQALNEVATRAAMSSAGRAVADERYGDAERFVDRVSAAARALGATA